MCNRKRTLDVGHQLLALGERNYALTRQRVHVRQEVGLLVSLFVDVLETQIGKLAQAIGAPLA